MSDTGESKGRAGRIAGGIAAAVITVGALVGGVALWNGVAQAQDAQASYVASDHTYSVAMSESEADDQQVQADAIQQQHINDVNAQVQAAEDAKAAAAAAAAQAAADAAAAQAAQDQAAQQTQSDDSSSVGSTSNDPVAPVSSGLPAGSPVPSIPGTDSPDTTQCASGTASTINGVPTCD